MVQFISLEKQIYFGVRGDTNLDLTVYASKDPYSGHYGNWAPNPAMMLIISFNEDDDGRVTIKGFYDDVIPLGPSEKLALLSVPSVDNQMKTELGMGAPEMKVYQMKRSTYHH
jgi:hypothetical protein